MGRTEFDSPDVDNEVLLISKHYVKTGDFAMIK
jgi:ribosomal protein S12 methylthiotransferase